MIRVTLKRETSNNKRSILDKQIIDDYYLLVIYEIERGEAIENIEIRLKEYESREMYLECAGIYKAIDHIKFFAIYELIIRLCLDEQTDNIKINYDKREY
mgnify:FL=1